MTSAVDLMGRRFGRLIVVERAARERPSKGVRWLCRCDCGNVITVLSGCLGSGNTQSCGCATREHTKAMGLANRTHGQTKTRTYSSWCEMNRRCEDPSHISYPRYGAKGVTVCERWRHSFENFLADMGGRPSGMTLDRIDNDKGYEPGNCRWATPLQQTLNRRMTRSIEWQGNTYTLKALAAHLGFTTASVAYRLERGIPLDAPKHRGYR